MRALLERVPGWAGRARVIEALGGGLTNRNLVVEVGAARFVIRLPGNETELLNIDHAVEREANARAAGLGFAPEVVAFLEPEGCLVTRFVAGGPVTSEELAEPERLHTITRVRPARSTSRARSAAPSTALRFRASISTPQWPAAWPSRPGGSTRATYAREIEAAFTATPEPWVPCHNDLNTANWLADGSHMWLLDWEYTGMNERFFDLGALTANNDFDATAEEQLLIAYFGATSPRQLAGPLMKVLSDLREAMWGLVQQGISELNIDYVNYTDSRVERLLRNASRPDYRRLLTDAATPEPRP